MSTPVQTVEARFPLGHIFMTPGAEAALEEADQTPFEFFQRHVRGDWGDLDEHDRQLNEASVDGEGRLLSVYHTSRHTKLYVITEWDRSVSTILLPSEY